MIHCWYVEEEIHHREEKWRLLYKDQNKYQVNHQNFFNRFNLWIYNIPRECPVTTTWVALWAAIAVWTAERMSIADLDVPFKSQHSNSQWTRPFVGWLTWHALLKNLCELRLSHWNQGRVGSLTVPIPRWNLCLWISYTQISNELLCSEPLLKLRYL